MGKFHTYESNTITHDQSPSVYDASLPISPQV